MRAVVFHNVVAESLDIFDRALLRTAAGRFRRTVDLLRCRYKIVSLSDAVAALDEGDPAPDALVITFDDGFASVYEIARPILREAGVVASVFVLSGAGGPIPTSQLLHFERLEIAFRLTKARTIEVHELGLPSLALSSDRQRLDALQSVKRALKRLPEPEQTQQQTRLMEKLGVAEAEIAAFAARFAKYRKLSTEQARGLAREGWTIGGHTRTHRPLSTLAPDEMRHEIAGNFEDLRSTLALSEIPFAYPYGSPESIADDSPEVVKASGFSCAFTTTPGDNGRETDRFRLGRFSDIALMADLTIGGTPAAVVS